MTFLRYMLGDEVLSHRFRDGRRKRVVLNYLKLKAVAETCPDPVTHERLKSCHRAIRSQGRLTRYLFAGVFFTVGLGITALMFSITVKGGWSRSSSSFAGMIVAPLMFAAIGIGVLRGAFGYNPARVTRTMIAHSVCPVCLRFLDDVPMQDDGCGVCTGCGSAWKLA